MSCPSPRLRGELSGSGWECPAAVLGFTPRTPDFGARNWFPRPCRRFDSHRVGAGFGVPPDVCHQLTAWRRT
ncbi:hypothetical protein FRAAL6514 [Frankia alni ACN14a]|uniref:Uncharacterized protein n=1 Tax=Frankia alni (strain DSM 45986 / CECT 9034 / ACN14a) TaxID=326424 RepID=Q0RBP7_FRAAA|nr:hypothetical protein FRAAL6514 [Frankia alni ACN14a]